MTQVDMVRYLRSGFGRYPKMAGIPHVVVVGDMSAEALSPLLQVRTAAQRLASMWVWVRIGPGL